MSKPRLTVFLCTAKDCCKAWSRAGIEHSPGKWLKHLVKEAGLPYKLDIVKTGCMDHCEQAACLCVVGDGTSAWETEIRSRHDADRLLATLRVCAEEAESGGCDTNRDRVIPSRLQS